MTQQEPIQIEVLLDANDLLRANYWFFFKKVRRLFIIIFVVGIAYPIWCFSSGMSASSENQNNWGFLYLPAICFVLLLSIYFGVKRNMKSNRALQEKIRYSFTENGIDAVAQSSSGHNSWSNIREAYETKNNFLLFISNNQMYTIPKRAFESVDQMNSFKQLLIAKLQSHAKLKKT